MPLPANLTESLAKHCPGHGRSGENNQQATITGTLDHSQLKALGMIVQSAGGHLELVAGALVVKMG